MYSVSVISNSWLQRLQYIGHSQVLCAFNKTFFVCILALYTRVSVQFSNHSFSCERISVKEKCFAMIAEFLAATLFFKVGRFVSILRLHSLVHTDAPSIT